MSIFLTECPTCELDLALTIESYHPEEKSSRDYPGAPASGDVAVVADESVCACDHTQRDLNVHFREVMEHGQDRW